MAQLKLLQAKELFGHAAEGGAGAEEEADVAPEGGGDVGGGAPAADKLLPHFVVSLDAPDEYLCERIMVLPESEILVSNAHFKRIGFKM